MKCEVEYCIYNRDSVCICDITQLNSLGMCEECILVSLDKDFLEAQKERQLQQIEERWREESASSLH